MKNLFVIIGLMASLSAFSQTTTNSSGGTTTVTNAAPPPIGWTDVGKAVLADLENATNYAVAPYVSVGLDNKKVGGGILALYNFNQFVGAGIGVDYMGSFSLVSGNVELKAPVAPLLFTGSSFGTNFIVTPFVYTGIGTPIGGTSGSSVSTHVGAGMSVDLASLWGGKISIGGAYVDRQNAGPVYSGRYLNGFLAWRKGF